MDVYALILQDCIGTECNDLNIPVSYFALQKDEIFKVHSYYNYFGEPDELWNTEHPIIELRFRDLLHFKVYYELPPGSYQYIKVKEGTEFTTTTFLEVDLVEREDSLESNKEEHIRAADSIIASYKWLSKTISSNRLKQYQWPNIYASSEQQD